MLFIIFGKQYLSLHSVKDHPQPVLRPGSVIFYMQSAYISVEDHFEKAGGINKHRRLGIRVIDPAAILYIR